MHASFVWLYPHLEELHGASLEQVHLVIYKQVHLIFYKILLGARGVSNVGCSDFVLLFHLPIVCGLQLLRIKLQCILSVQMSSPDILSKCFSSWWQQGKLGNKCYFRHPYFEQSTH